MKREDEWSCGGWEGAELQTLRDGMKLHFRKKLEWLEEAQRMASQLSNKVAETRETYGDT